jgi:enamine deaminase RidA (YjgF/YER057c/UK114 family)
VAVSRDDAHRKSPPSHGTNMREHCHRNQMEIKHLNTAEIHSNPAYSPGVSVPASARYVHVGGQNGIDAAGRIVGRGDIAAQTAQALGNLFAVLAAGGAKPDDLVSLSVYLVQDADLRVAFGVWTKFWGDRGRPPMVKLLRVVGLASPDFLIEIEGWAAIAEDTSE